MTKVYSPIILITMSLVLLGCRFIYHKADPRKSEIFNAVLKYNYYKYYTAEFESCIGKTNDDMVHFGLNFLDSTYYVRITNGDPIPPNEENFKGKYSVNERGTVVFLGDSPFLNNTYQIITQKKCIQTGFYARFKLNKKYAQIYGSDRKRAYCETGYVYEIDECIVR